MASAGRWGNPAFRWYQFLWQALDWVYPPTCGGCARPGMRWCADCRQQVTVIGANCCPVCGQPGQPVICQRCQSDPPPYAGLRSWGIFQGTLRNAIHTLKYKKDIGIGEALAAHMIELYSCQGWTIDLVTAVPLSCNRQKQRGYNQSRMLAHPLALALQKPFCPGAVQRIRETRTQVGLNAQERRLNVAGAFRAEREQVEGKTALVIDDVTTTGSTIQACARALLEAGAAAVYGMTLARAAGPHADADLTPAETA